MFYIIPTKKGLGVELWGTNEDLQNLHDTLGKFWNDENKLTKVGFESRDRLLSGFSYELRKALESSRLKRDSSHFSFEKMEYFGCKISWVHFIFSLSAWKYNMRYNETNKLDVATILQLEFWLESAMKSYDEIGAKKLIGYVNDGIFAANNNIYQFMRSINLDYFLLGGGKRSFRQLSQLLKRAVYSTDEYKEYNIFLEKEAIRLQCKIDDLELSDESFNYDIAW